MMLPFEYRMNSANGLLLFSIMKMVYKFAVDFIGLPPVNLVLRTNHHRATPSSCCESCHRTGHL